MVKKILPLFEVLAILIFILSFINLVSAITGSIGNARMVLRIATGEEIEKYILVKNVNNVSIDIELNALGDLAEQIKIRDNKFSLNPGEEKKAYFTVKAKEEGITETKINVRFIPKEGSGVGLSSTVIVIAKANANSGVKKFFFIPLLLITGFLIIVFIFLLTFLSARNKPKKSVKRHG